MANFKTHMAGAIGVSGVSASTLLATNLVSPNEALLFFSIGTIGGILPDIDSPTSMPYKIAFNLLSVLFAFMIVFQKSYSVIEMIILFGVVYSLFKYVLFPLFDKYTHHRGIFHSVPMAVLLGFLTSIMLDRVFWTREFVAVWGGVFLTLGYLTHLTLDEIHSVDLMNKRLKKSFGTALKFWSKNHFKTVFVYGGIFLAIQYIPNYDYFLDNITSSTLYSDIFYNLTPSGDRMWFENLIKIEALEDIID